MEAQYIGYGSGGGDGAPICRLGEMSVRRLDALRQDDMMVHGAMALVREMVMT
jgi:hypothetical protein